MGATDKAVPLSQLDCPLDAAAYEALGARGSKDEGLQTLRRLAFERLCSMPFTTATHELWRFTKPDLFDFSRMASSMPISTDVSGWPVGSAAPNVEVSEALPRELALELWEERGSDAPGDAIPYLQLASAASLTFVRVKRNEQIAAPLRIAQRFAPSSTACPLVVVLVEEGASVHFIEDLHEGSEAFVAPRYEFLLRDNARFSFLSNNRLPDTAVYLGRHRVHAGRDVTADVCHFITGAKVTRLDLDCRMYGPGSNVNLSSVYIADGKRHVDLHTVQDHLAPYCRSDLLSKGVLRESARSVYFGFIKVAERAQRTDAYQTNRNLVLSRNARADSIPNLEIKANDVKCSHGATVGRVSEDELFYLMTRGIRRPDAEQLLVEGFVDEVLGRISDESAHELVRDSIIGRIRNGSVVG